MNLRRMENRTKLIDSINSDANKARKQWSLRQFEVQNGRIQQYVKEDLEGQYSVDSVKEMPVVSSINIQKRIVDKKASIYKESPKRTFSDLEGTNLETLELIYKDMKINSKLNKSNKAFVYQNQSIGMILPKNGKLEMRIFKMHQIDNIPNPSDPETSGGFIISCFDRENYIQLYSNKKERSTATGVSGRSVRSSASAQDGLNSETSNEYEFKKYVEKYIVWTKELNFMMNGHGEVLDPETGEPSNDIEIESPLASEGIMPFFEIATEKDFEFFVRASNSMTDFTIQFNTRLSDESNNIKMNGYAVGVLKAPSELQPQNQIIGPAMMLKLPTDGEGEVDFSFASPNSNIGEISEANDKLLNYFITSEGLGSSAINSRGEAEKYNSGLDRFIAMIDRVQASKDDYELFSCAEADIYNIIKAWLRVLSSSDQLDAKYKTTIPEESEVTVEYAKPEMVQTETEKLNNIKLKREEKLISRTSAIMELYNVDRERAEEIKEEIDEEEPEITIPNFNFNNNDEE